jgi:arginase family enzyme
LGTISGIKVYPTKRLGVVLIDAHADLHSPYTSPSGNIHGMPLSAALEKIILIAKSTKSIQIQHNVGKILRILVFMALK